MDAFHSARGREMYKRLPKSAPETAAVLDASVAPYSKTELNFRELRAKLEELDSLIGTVRNVGYRFNTEPEHEYSESAY